MTANTVAWLIPKRVIFFNMEGHIDRASFSAINEAVAALVAEGEAPVHLVADIRDLKSLAMNVQWIAKTTAIRSPKIACVTVIGANGYFAFTTKAIQFITKSKIQTVNDVTEAYHALSQCDSTLPQRL